MVRPTHKATVSQDVISWSVGIGSQPDPIALLVLNKDNGIIDNEFRRGRVVGIIRPTIGKPHPGRSTVTYQAFDHQPTLGLPAGQDQFSNSPYCQRQQAVK